MPSRPYDSSDDMSDFPSDFPKLDSATAKVAGLSGTTINSQNMIRKLVGNNKRTLNTWLGNEGGDEGAQRSIVVDYIEMTDEVLNITEISMIQGGRGVPAIDHKLVLRGKYKGTPTSM